LVGDFRHCNAWSCEQQQQQPAEPVKPVEVQSVAAAAPVGENPKPAEACEPATQPAETASEQQPRETCCPNAASMLSEILSSLTVNPEIAAALPNLLAMAAPLLNSGFEQCCGALTEPLVALVQALIQDPAFIKQLIELIRTVHTTARRLAKERELAAKRATPRFVHHAICDNCSSPIRGIRYKCLVCADFDLCEACEQLPNIHNEAHSFVKVRKPLQGRAAGHSVNDPRATFVRDVNIEDDSVLIASQSYTKKWALRNTGLVALPQGCKLVYVNGNKLDVTSIEPIPTAKPGEEFEVTINFEAPAAAGKYKTVWVLTDAQNNRFGDPFWIQFSIPEPVVQETKWQEEVALLREMGFSTIDQDVLQFYLDNYKGNVQAVLTSILRQTDK